MRIAAIVAAGLLAAAAASAAPTARPPGEVERALRAAARTGQIPPTLSVQYTDTSTGLGNPETFALSANGRLRRTGPGRPQTRTVRIPRSEVLGVVRLLVRLRVWRQEAQTQPPPIVIYNQFVEISVGGARTNVWEWYTGDRSGRLGLVGIRLSKLFNAHR